VRDAGAMNLDVLTTTSIFIGLIVLLDLAAMRWGVDSRFRDIRSDF
jgi:hypothetical protein